MSLISLFMCFWKHTGSCIIMVIYIFSYPFFGVVVIFFEPFIKFNYEVAVFFVIHVIQHSMFVVFWWVLFNIPALLFSFRMQDTEKREKRYKRIVFWLCFTFLILGSFGAYLSRIQEGLVK